MSEDKIPYQTDKEPRTFVSCDHLYAVKREPGAWDIRHANGASVGEALVQADGYHGLFMRSRGGFLSAGDLLSLAQLLRLIDAPWDQQVQADLGARIV